MFPIQWDSKLPYWQHCNKRTADEVRKRYQPNDFFASSAATVSTDAEQLKDLTQLIVVEYGIGYQACSHDGRFSRATPICTSSWVFKTLTAMPL